MLISALTFNVQAQWINTVSVSPDPATTADDIIVNAYVWIPNSECWVENFVLDEISPNVWQLNVVYNMGFLTAICDSYETFNLGTFPAGEHELTFISSVVGLPTSDATTVSFTVEGGPTPPATFSGSAFLQGPYNTSTQQMDTDLNAIGEIPLVAPYGGAPWNYAGFDTIFPSIPTDMVDWVLLELFDPVDTTLIESKACLLLADGQIVNANSSQPITFENVLSGESAFVAVRPRNHLAVISNAPLVFPVTDFNFSDPANIMGGAGQLHDFENGDHALLAGDLNADGYITTVDLNIYLLESSLVNTYVPGDVDMDGSVTVADFNMMELNASIIGAGPIRY